MRRIWKRKWWVLATALVIFLSVGAVAWAVGGDDSTSTTSTTVAPGGLGLGGPLKQALVNPDSEIRQAIKEAREALKNAIQAGKEELAATRAERLKNLRDRMTPADQQLFDQLAKTAEDQEATLKQARDNLHQTLQQLRELAKKYIPAPTTTTTTSP